MLKTCQRLCNECLLFPFAIYQATTDKLTMSLINIWSLRKYSSDLLSDADLLNNDVLCLTDKTLIR